MILGGDVGGTKTTLALFEPGDEGPVLVRDETLPSHEFESVEAAIERFLERGPRVSIAAACVGVAGPVLDGRCVATNLPWVVDERLLAYSIPAEHVRLLNDLEATAHGIFALAEDELVPLQSGLPRRGNLAVIAAGTGLGEAVVVVDGRARTVLAIEGGHTDFGPRGELEEELLRYLRKAFGHVSYERVLSGPGLLNIYRFLRDTGVAPESAQAAQMMRERDPAAVITELGARRADGLCASALTVFVSIYGAEAGNLALKTMALGGVVLAGGIAPRIVPALTAGPFVSAFRDKGRMASLMETIPVSVALNPKTALLGAARVAQSLLQRRAT